MGGTDISTFKALFVSTARDQLVVMKENLQHLQSDLKNAQAIEKVFIASHSLKGESFAIGHMSTGTLCQMVEKIFYAAKEQQLVLTLDLLAAVNTAVSKVEESIACIEKENKELVLNEEVMRLEKVSGIALN